MLKILYLDVETTGLIAGRNDIVQLSYILTVEGVEKVRRNLFLRPTMPDHIDNAALAVQGRTVDELMAYPEGLLAYNTFVTDMSDHISRYDKKDKARPCAYAGRFDLDFMFAWFEQFSDPYLGSFIDQRRLLDPIALIRWLDIKHNFPVDNFKLKTMCDLFGIKIKAHDAMSDIEAVVELVKHLDTL